MDAMAWGVVFAVLVLAIQALERVYMKWILLLRERPTITSAELVFVGGFKCSEGLLHQASRAQDTDLGTQVAAAVDRVAAMECEMKDLKMQMRDQKHAREEGIRPGLQETREIRGFQGKGILNSSAFRESELSRNI